MKKRIRSCFLCTVFAGVLLFFAGCSIVNSDAEKLRDLEYTVVAPSEIPEELYDEIEENKSEVFHLTYSDGESLYIANGYGVQESGGYSVRMKALYLTEQAIRFESELYGPEDEESEGKTPTCPYIVIKTELIDNPIIFE